MITNKNQAEPNILHIASHMTLAPTVITEEVPVRIALQRMWEKRVRHLPVVVGDKVVGILSERNLRAATFMTNAEEMTVKDAMIKEPYVVLPETNLVEVLKAMAENNYGSAMVQSKDHKILGIFTTMDAVKLLIARFEDLAGQP